MNAPRSVLVTGANGFLGSHLVARLCANGDRVYAMTRAGSDGRRLAGIAGLERLTGDITDPVALAQCCAMARPEIIYHFAGDTAARRFHGDWLPVRAAFRTNFDGLINLLETASEAGGQLRTLVRVGGLEEYGNGPVPFREDQREAPRSPYSASQVAGTHLCQMLQPHLAFAVVTLRPTLIYGPDQSIDFLIPALVEALLDGRRFALTSGTQTRDMLHVDDFVAAALAAGERSDLSGLVLNIASGEATTIRALAEKIAALLDAEALLDVGGLPGRPRDILDLRGSGAAAAERLGWQPRIALAEGLRDLVAHARQTRAAAT